MRLPVPPVFTVVLLNRDETLHCTLALEANDRGQAKKYAAVIGRKLGFDFETHYDDYKVVGEAAEWKKNTWDAWHRGNAEKRTVVYRRCDYEHPEFNQGVELDVIDSLLLSTIGRGILGSLRMLFGAKNPADNSSDNIIRDTPKETLLGLYLSTMGVHYDANEILRAAGLLGLMSSVPSGKPIEPTRRFSALVKGTFVSGNKIEVRLEMDTPDWLELLLHLPPKQKGSAVYVIPNE